jgi:S1-C subfamily serine protease
MRENDSDGEGSWAQSPGYVSPWAPREEDRDEGDAARPRWPGANTAPPPEAGYQDTIAFGTPSGYGNQPGYGNQSGQAWYGSASYGSQPGYGQGGSGEPASHPAGGGFGAPGWALPDPPPRPSGRGGRFLVYVAVAALAASIGAGATVALSHHGAAPASGISSRAVPGPHNNASGSGSSSARLNRAAVQKKVDPGLVDIVSTLKYNSETAEGTGMIISATGLVLTNNHVIDGATVVHATLVDPRANSNPYYTAKVVGYDATDDVALLQLEGASGLPIEHFGNSSQVSLGTPVLALGNAEGRGGARPAAGIINALDRSIQASDEGSNSTENLNHMLQTNARIQQGDSGGALANNAGQVIGMITAANTGTSSQFGSAGGTLGFAIPINSALAIAKQIASARPSATVYIGLPGFLGVEVATSDSSNPQQQAADEAQSGSGRAAGSASSCQANNQQAGVPARVAPIAAGALIVGVLCDTAATSAGMVPGDVITSVDGQPITTPSSLTSIAAMHHPGVVVSVLWVSRDGVEHTTRMKLGQGPAR